MMPTLPTEQQISPMNREGEKVHLGSYYNFSNQSRHGSLNYTKCFQKEFQKNILQADIFIFYRGCTEPTSPYYNN